MPIAKRWSIAELIDAAKYFFEKTRRRVIFEYSLIDGVNCAPEQAVQLAKLVKGFPSHVNLINLNQTPRQLDGCHPSVSEGNSQTMSRRSEDPTVSRHSEDQTVSRHNNQTVSRHSDDPTVSRHSEEERRRNPYMDSRACIGTASPSGSPARLAVPLGDAATSNGSSQNRVLAPPSKEAAMKFMDTLIKAGASCTMRKSRGDDIMAACGQLKTRFDKKGV